MGRPRRLRLKREPQVLAQIGGIGHADDEIRRALARAPTEQHIGRDLLVGSQRIEAVGARQIENAHAPPRGRQQRAFLALDGDAGVVGDLLPAAGEHVEQRRLAAVRVTDQGDQGTRIGAQEGIHGPIRVAAAPGKRARRRPRTAAVRKYRFRCAPRWARARAVRGRRCAPSRPAESRAPPGAVPFRRRGPSPGETDTTRAAAPVARSASPTSPSLAAEHVSVS